MKGKKIQNMTGTSRMSAVILLQLNVANNYPTLYMLQLINGFVEMFVFFIKYVIINAVLVLIYLSNIMPISQKSSNDRKGEN
jgi:hypothetical protein